MTTFIIRRLIQGLIVLLVVTLLVFGVMRFLPGDPLMLYVAQNQLENISSEQMDKLKHEFGLDKSVPIQYVDWMKGVLKGDLGNSIFYHEKVSTLSSVNAYLLHFMWVYCAFLLSSVVGIYSRGDLCSEARQVARYGRNRACQSGHHYPGFWFGILLIYMFGLKLRVASGSRLYIAVR